MESYYREKLIKLTSSMFTHYGDAKMRFIANEDNLFTVYLAAKSIPNETEIFKFWDNMWSELNINEPITDSKGNVIRSSFCNTVLSKRNKSLEKYLFFIIEEFYKVI